MLKGPYIAIFVAFLLLLLIRISVARRNEGFAADDDNEGITAASMFNSSDDSMDLARPPAGSMDLLSPPPAEFRPTIQTAASSDTGSVLDMAASAAAEQKKNASGNDSPQCMEWKKGKMAGALALSLGADALDKNPAAAEMVKKMMNAPAPAGCT